MIFTGTLIANATLPPLTPPPSGGYDSGLNSILDPGCAPNTLNCWVNLPGGGSGWSLTGNAGTTAGTNFIGTTDAQDFMVKTNGNQIALFGQNGNVAIGRGLPSDYLNPGDPLGPYPLASGDFSFAAGTGTVSSGIASTTFGLGNIASGMFSFSTGVGNQATGQSSIALGQQAQASGYGSFAFSPENSAVASGSGSVAIGDNTEARGDDSFAFGSNAITYDAHEIVFNGNSAYTPSGNLSFNRLFTIGNNNNTNAYTLWKDGSFAYNDDNFQNDTAGTEQNMFYFNYGNHDGLGNGQTKRAIRLGSAVNDEWDITSANVGDRSMAIGFGSAIASGENTFAFGNAIAEGDNSVAFNQGYAQGQQSFAWGKNAVASDSSFAFSTGNSATASGNESWALGSGVNASGDYSKSFGLSTSAYSFAETVLGLYNTNYVANDPTLSDSADRLFTIGNGASSSPGFESDAFTILKSGQTGIAIDNFETNTNGNIFQVGDGSTGIIGYVDNGTGNWMAVSDERKKHNITDISYGLSEIMKLRPVSFDYNRNNEHTIGFLAQQVLPIIPEAVGGDEEKGYSMSYATLTPALVKAIQELNLKVDTLQLANGTTSTSIFDSLKDWFADTTNGIGEFVVGTLRARNQVCIDDVCMNKDQLRAILNTQGGLTNAPVLDSPEILPNTETLPNENIDSSINVSEGLPDSTSTSIDDPINNTETVVQNSGDIVSDTQ